MALRSSGRNRVSRRRAPDVIPGERRPEIVIDFQVEGGCLFVALKNIGNASAYRVVTKFDRSFHGLGGTKDIAAMALFRGVEFVPPGKQFLQLVDQLHAYFGRKEPSRLKATVSYSDRDGKQFEDVMPHDLEIYRDLGGFE